MESTAQNDNGTQINTDWNSDNFFCIGSSPNELAWAGGVKDSGIRGFIKWNAKKLQRVECLAKIIRLCLKIYRIPTKALDPWPLEALDPLPQINWDSLEKHFLCASVLISGLFVFLQDLHVLHGEKCLSVLLKLRALRVLRGKNAFVQPQIFIDSHRSME